MIYGYCLVVNGHIVPYEENHVRDKDLDYTGDKPTVTLLTVSKAVQKEAAKIFYGKNVWRITSQAPIVGKYTGYRAKIFPATLWRVHARLYRRVVVHAHSLDLDNLDLPVLESITQATPAQTLQERMLSAHNLNFDRMLGCWDSKVNFVWRMPNLDSVTFDLRKLYCLNGCCHAKVQRELLRHYTECWCDPVGGHWHSPMVRYLEAVHVVGLSSSLRIMHTPDDVYGRAIPWVVEERDPWRVVDDEEDDSAAEFSGDENEDELIVNMIVGVRSPKSHS